MPVAVDTREPRSPGARRRRTAPATAPARRGAGERPVRGGAAQVEASPIEFDRATWTGTGRGEPSPTTVRVRRPRRRTRSALDVLVVGLVAYGGAAVLNASHLHRRAEQLPLDAPGRGALVATAGALDRAGALVGLDRPGASIDDVRHLDAGEHPVPTPAIAPSTDAARSTDAAERRSAYEAAASAARAAERRAEQAARAAARAKAARVAAAQPAFADARWQRLPADDLVVTAPAPNLADVGPAAPSSVRPRDTTSPTNASTNASTTSSATGPATPSGIASAPTVRQLRQPTVADPWRVYVGGDSLAQGIGPALGRIGTGNGLMAVAAHGVLSSGLARPDAYDWPSTLAEAAQSDSEIVVLVFGANDPQPMAAGGASIAFGTPAWEQEYARRVGAVLDELDGKTVVWVGLPVVGRPDLERQLQVLDRIYRAQVARHQNAIYLDTRAITSTDGVSYQPYLDAGDGQEFLARTNDKVHFTTGGYDLLAQAVSLRLVQLTAA